MVLRKLGALSGMVGRLLAMVVLVVGGLQGCASLSKGPADTGAGRTIWKVREQFVEVVPQERGVGTANDHPVSVSPAELRRYLASVAVLLPGAGAPVPLLSDTELKVLEDAGLKGLSQAAPDEDVTFAVYGYHPALQGFLKQTKVTTGRMFYQEGRLNLIFGIVQREVLDTEDRRLNPFVPGSRLTPSILDGRITAVAGGVPFTLKRPDWLVFAPAGSVPPPAEPTKSRPEAVAPVVAPAAPVAPVPEAPKRVDRPAGQTRSLEERLMLLNELKQKGLITEEEYRAKRTRILDEL